MPLIYACIAPHAGDLIPETVEDKNIVALTRNSMIGTHRDLSPDAETR